MHILAICYEFPPLGTPAAVKSSELLARLAPRHEVHVLTHGDGPAQSWRGIHVHRANGSPWLRRMHAALPRVRPSLLRAAISWPDARVFWSLGVIHEALDLAKSVSPDIVLVFMMPYSAAMIGARLKHQLRVPLYFNFGDSPTCPSLHADSVTVAHAVATRWYERWALSQADIAAYVSQLTLDRVRRAQPSKVAERLVLHRRGAPLAAGASAMPAVRPPGGAFEILYTGGMNGWWSFLPKPASSRARALRRLTQALKHSRAEADFAGSSPVFLGRALKRVLADRPEWRERIRIRVVGPLAPKAVVDQVLQDEDLVDLVRVEGPVSSEQVQAELARADLLFMTLPDQPRAFAAPRISAKTYEYLMTARPILAALPDGENRNFLSRYPGVWLSHPKDEAALEASLRSILTLHEAHGPLTFERPGFEKENSYGAKASELEATLEALVGANDGSQPDRRPEKPATTGQRTHEGAWEN